MSLDRRGFLGGSDIGPLIGQSPYKDAFGLYLEKRGEIEPPEEETKVQRRGRILEPAIGQMYAAEHNRVLLPGETFAVDEPWQRAQVDAIEHFTDGVIDVRVPVEIKSASEFARGKWGPSGTDEAPTAYCAQLHWQMAAMRAPFGRIVALLGADDLRVYTIDRDWAIDAFLQEQARAFWQRVLDGNAPEPNFQHPSIAETLSRLFQNPKAAEILQATPQLTAWRDVMVEAGEQEKRYQGIKDGAKAHLLHAMGNAAIINFGEQMFERKVINRAGYTVAPTTYVAGTLKKSTVAGALPALLTNEVAA